MRTAAYLRSRQPWGTVAYLGLVAVMLALFFVYTAKQDSDLRHRNRELCKSFLAVKENQKVVLGTLAAWGALISDRADAGLRPVPLGQVATIRARLAVLDERAVCRP